MANAGLFQLISKYRELIPLFTFVGGAGLWAVFSSFHAINKPEVVINKTGNPEPWQNVDPTKVQKLLRFNQEWKPIEELEKVKRLMK